MPISCLVAGLLLYTVLSVFGLFFIKAANAWFSLQFSAGFILYGSGFLLWLYLLKKLPLSLIFPLCSACILIGTQVVGWTLLHEHISCRVVLAVLLSLAASILIATEI